MVAISMAVGWHGARLPAVLVAAAATIAGLCITRAAAEPSELHWASRAWEIDQLFPGDGAGGTVRGVVPGGHGTLVVGTTLGFFCFDGVRFTAIPLELSPAEAPHVHQITRAASGHIAAVLSSGRIVRIDADGRVSSAECPTGGTGSQATSIAIDAEGCAWVAYDEGSVLRIGAGGEHRPVTGDGHPFTGRTHLAGDETGRIWVCTRDELLIARDGHLVRVAAIPAGISIVTAARGRAWVKVQSQILRCELDGTLRRVLPTAANFTTPPVEEVVGTVRSLSEDDAGRLWLSSARHGLFVLDGESLAQVDVGETWIAGVCHDREGNVWAGTRLAIHRVRPGIAWPTPSPSWRPIVEMCRGGGRSWCLTRDGEVGSWRDGRFDEARFLPHDPDDRAVGIAADGHGNAWVGKASGEVVRASAAGAWGDALPRPHDAGDVTALFVTSGGDPWVGAGDALRAWIGDRWMPIDLAAAGRAAIPVGGEQTDGGVAAAVGTVRHVAEDDAGGLWIASDVRLFRVATATAAPVATLPFGSARLGRIVKATPDAAWVTVPGKGLCRWRDGRWTTVSPEQGLPTDEIAGSAVDAAGRLWCAAPRMLFVVDEAELDLVADGVRARCHCWVLPPRHETDFLEGIASPACAMMAVGDGTLLAALQSGLVVCDPRLLPSASAPTVAVRRVASDDVVRFVAGSGGAPPSGRQGTVSLPPGPRRVEIDVAAATLRAPTNVLVECRLDGIDDDWIQAPANGRVAYQTLPAGTHRFRLRSSDHATLWEPVEPALTLFIATPWWETWWFRALALVTASGIAATTAMTVVVRQGRKRVALLRQQAAVDGERIRLARDMHDEVGTNLTQIALLAEVAKDDAATTQTERLETMARISRETVASLDELVWTVDPVNDTLTHLLSYACRYASETLREFGIACEVESPADLPLLETPGHFRRGVLLVVKEAVTNILAHARARHVALRIAVDRGRLRVTIADDGVGIAGAAVGSGAGLGNMAQRAAALGGRCRIEPGPTGGTIVALDVPLAVTAVGGP